MPGPRHVRHDNTVLGAGHPRRVGLDHRLHRAQIQRPPAASSLTRVVPPAAALTDSTAARSGAGRPDPTDQHLGDQWGYVPFPVQRLTPHSLSRLVHQMMAGDFGAHRRIPVDDELPDPEQPAPVPVEVRRVYTREDAHRAWARRRADIEELAGLDDILAEIDARARALEHRTAAILAAETPTIDPWTR